MKKKLLKKRQLMKKETIESKYMKSNPETIVEMFSTIANKYDRANAVLSFNLHKYWNRQLVKNVLKRTKPTSCAFLDVCCGTGDIALEIMKFQKTSSEVFFLDFCPEMLKCAEKKIDLFRNINIHEPIFIQGDAQNLPFQDHQMDCITIAYGIRNIKSPEKCIQESYRTLKKDGIIGILELTQPSNKILKYSHNIYLQKIMPQLGKLIATNKNAYDYLCNSINTFIPPNELMNMLSDHNFQNVTKISLLGGIATILIAEK